MNDGSLSPEEYADDHPNRRRTSIGRPPHAGLLHARTRVWASSDPRDMTVIQVPITGTIHRVEVVEHFAIVFAHLVPLNGKKAAVYRLEPPHKIPPDYQLVIRLMTPPETAPGKADTFLEVWFSSPTLRP